MERCQIRSDYFRSNPDTILEAEKGEKRKLKKKTKNKNSRNTHKSLGIGRLLTHTDDTKFPLLST